ncbi:MAG TPA: nuclear transport factor 2 family protein, partial [Pyrinomonadaceae bacterium]|nr:nuclear transport factor 2 family protein [Pyrinomonadaceae bacterium]
MSSLEPERLQRRINIVDEHIRCENQHDLDAVMATFGNDAHYDDEPWEDHRHGRDGVRTYYGELLHALPDLKIQVKGRHVAADSVIVEVTITGTHLGPWR